MRGGFNPLTLIWVRQWRRLKKYYKITNKLHGIMFAKFYEIQGPTDICSYQSDALYLVYKHLSAVR